MKRLAGLFTAMIAITISQVSMAQNGDLPSGKQVIIASSVKTVTKNVPVLVKSPRIAKPKIFRSNPHRAVYYASVEDSDDILIYDDDIYTGYRRETFTKIKTEPTADDPDGIITEEIRWKLFLARTAAMVRYHQLHG